MNTNARIGPIQSNPVPTDIRISRVRTLRVFGGLQISLGIVCGILGIAGAILGSTGVNKSCNDFNYYNSYYGSRNLYYHCGNGDGILVMDLISVLFSGWFIMTGSFPLCMTEQRISSWRCLKITFLICNIISAVVMSSTVFGLGVVGAIMAEFSPNTQVLTPVSALLAVCSFIEFIICIVAASFCCCCSQLSAVNHQGAIFVNTAQSGMMYNMPSTQVSTSNQQGYNQMWMPQMQGYNIQQPANMPYYQSQRGNSQGNRMPMQGYHGQQPQGYAMDNQQQNINSQQLVYPTAPETAVNESFPTPDNSATN